MGAKRHCGRCHWWVYSDMAYSVWAMVHPINQCTARQHREDKDGVTSTVGMCITGVPPMENGYSQPVEKSMAFPHPANSVYHSYTLKPVIHSTTAPTMTTAIFPILHIQDIFTQKKNGGTTSLKGKLCHRFVYFMIEIIENI